jgi:hypothetical protein
MRLFVRVACTKSCDARKRWGKLRRALVSGFAAAWLSLWRVDSLARHATASDGYAFFNARDLSFVEDERFDARDAAVGACSTSA